MSNSRTFRSADGRPGRLSRASAALLCGVALATAVPSGAVSAHAVVETISPADGSALAASPVEMIVEFSEPVLGEGLSVELISTGSVDGDAVPALDPTDPSRLVVTLPRLTEGTHQIRITARDAADLHLVVARASFAVGVAAPAPSAPVVAAPEPFEAAARWIFAAGLALLVGVLITRSRWPDVPVSRTGRLRGMTIVAVVGVGIGRVGVLLARAVALDGGVGSGLGTVMRTPDARRLILVAGALACTVPLWFPRRLPRLDAAVGSGWRLSVRIALGWVGVVWLAVLASWGDHSALDGAVEMSTALAKAVHLIGIGMWVGVLAVAVFVNPDPADRRTALSAQSRVAVVGALTAVASGLVLTSRLVVSLTGWFSTAYGAVLTAKIVLIVLAVTLGIAARRRVRPGWSVVEGGVLAGVLFAGAAMATAGPPIERSFLPPDGDVPRAASAPADDLLVQVRAIPGRPGSNTLEVRVSDTRRPAPAPITGIDVTADGESVGRRGALEAEGVAFVDDVLLGSGPTTVRVDVARGSWPVASAELEVEALDLPYVHPERVSSAPIRGPLRSMAIGVALIALVVGRRLFGRRRGRRREGGERCRSDVVVSVS